MAFGCGGGGSEGEFCQCSELEGDHDPCDANVFVFDFDLPGGTLVAGPCGKQYDICITLGSKDCCGVPGFVSGSCKDFHITVMPAVVAQPDGGSPLLQDRLGLAGQPHTQRRATGARQTSAAAWRARARRDGAAA